MTNIARDLKNLKVDTPTSGCFYYVLTYCSNFFFFCFLHVTEGAKVDDSFVEKLAAQIVKNVQIFIENIHVRYEDRVTKSDHPFSIGVSLHTLRVFTTNESCDRYILPQETSPIFYKVIKKNSVILMPHSGGPFHG